MTCVIVTTAVLTEDTYCREWCTHFKSTQVYAYAKFSKAGLFLLCERRYDEWYHFNKWQKLIWWRDSSFSVLGCSVCHTREKYLKISPTVTFMRSYSNHHTSRSFPEQYIQRAYTHRSQAPAESSRKKKSITCCFNLALKKKSFFCCGYIIIHFTF